MNISKPLNQPNNRLQILNFLLEDNRRRPAEKLSPA